MTQEHTSDDREEKLLIALSQYPTIYEAGQAAGYSDSYSRNLLNQKIKSESFQNRLREHYKGFTACLLPAIAKVESEVLKECIKDVNNVPKFGRTLKEIKQAAKILSPDIPQAPPTIHIDQVQVLMQQIQASKSPDGNMGDMTHANSSIKQVKANQSE